MHHPFALALIVVLPALVVLLYFVARRDLRFTPSPLHRILDPIAMSVMMLFCIGLAIFLAVMH
ncbi:hypothetical protein [Amnibacterium kyonggiense]|uniref:Uncharacterized protein n=1 Tax=Amnibacterium kyonggiense TaxID=595671 RepID=A0A4R7FTQ9_9MICO|nr:hypothetical protein [Amnibacterium kyonggiense]TDS81109.1 hypothetical protein CLV52_1685 [Amnibacterium kyonggiense]